jgi:polyhydroxyalkanoate synthesis repressor PhaR
MTAPRPLLVKKYGNRRLYDTDASRYITLEELAQLIRSGRDVRIIDAKTKADLTKSVLLQIIAEEEKERDLLPVSFLKKMIQLGDDSMREALPRYLTFSLDAFFAAQKQFESRYQHLAGSFLNPMAWLAPALARSPFGEPPLEPPPVGMPPEVGAPAELAPDDGDAGDVGAAAEDAAPPPEAEPPAEEPQKAQIDTLRAQVEQIQAMLAKLSAGK